MSDSLQPHGLQHTRLPCHSLFPRVCSNSCPLIRWCHPTISSSVTPFSSCPQSFPASWSFPMIQLFGSCGQSIGTSASSSVLPVNIQGWFPLEWTGLILAVQGTIKSLLQHHNCHMTQQSHFCVYIQEGLKAGCWRDYCTPMFTKVLFTTAKISVQFSCSVVSNSLWPHEPQHARPPCPSPTPVHWVSDAIQPSHPLSSSSPPALNPS